MLPIATQNDLGAIKVGTGLKAGDDGTLSVIGDAGGGLSMIVTYGSPASDSSMLNWSPTNLVTVYGPANMPLVVTATNGAAFIDHDPGLPEMKSVLLSPEGIGQAQVQLSVDASERVASIVAAPYIQPQTQFGQEVLNALATLRPVQCSTLFYPMMTDPSWTLLLSFGYTRGAPSDGVTPCVVTVVVDYPSAMDAKVTTLQMKVTQGEAVFDNKTGNANPRIVPYGEQNQYGIATANLYCASAGISTIDISVPVAGYPDDHAKAYVSFVAPLR